MNDGASTWKAGIASALAELDKDDGRKSAWKSKRWAWFIALPISYYYFLTSLLQLEPFLSG
jgi:hypothetical protein